MRDVTRRGLIGSVAAGLAGATVPTPAAAHFVGAPVYTTVDLSVRSGPGLAYDRIAVAEEATGGHVVDGPVDEDGYTWWEIEYNGDSDNGRVTGWSVQRYTAHADFAYPAVGTVSQEFHSDHAAVDVANDADPTYLHAAADGTVFVVDAVDDSACGRYVKLDHGGGWTTLYCHMDDIFVGEGESVARGEHVGTMGNTGHSTGQHVHFAVRHDGVGQFVPGFVGQEIDDRTGVPKDYR